MHLTNEQQKRLIAAELASKTMQEGKDPLEQAERWLKFIDAGGSMEGSSAIGKLLDIPQKGRS